MTDADLLTYAASLCNTTTYAIEDVKETALAAISELKSRIAELEAELAAATKGFVGGWEDSDRAENVVLKRQLAECQSDLRHTTNTYQRVSDELRECKEVVKNQVAMEVTALRVKLAECQAYAKALRSRLEYVDAYLEESGFELEKSLRADIAIERSMPHDETALREAIAQAKRETLLEAAESDRSDEWFTDRLKLEEIK